MKLLTRSNKTLLGLLLAAAGSPAHDLQDNRATLVLRDGNHLSVSLYLAYADALHAALAPQRPVDEFLVAYSAMKPELMRKELLRAQAKFQSATRLYLASGRELALTNWIWPDAGQVQAMLQRRIMQAMVDPAGHAHEEPLEVHADANSPEEITAVRVQFPEEFQKVLVVSYRPKQQWVEPKSWSPAIRFPGP
jgi:hypothetical protein